MKSIKKTAIGVLSLVFCLLLLNVHGARAQETADIVGTVTDSSGAVLPGATVTLTNTGTNVSQTVPTSANGDYVFNLLQVGTYTAKVEMKGFKTFTTAGVTIAAGDRARVDAKMEVGDISQTVEVSGTVAPALQTDTSTIGSLVPSQSVEDLPLNQRNIIKLVQLSPGATEGQPGSIAAGNRPDDRRMTSALSVNGQDDSTNQNMIDGFDNNTRIIGTIGVRPSIDAIQEVSITTNKYDASVGRTGGGVVEIVTKAGTNDIHGSAFEFFRNKVLNGNPNWNFNEALNLEAIKAGMTGATDPHSLPAANPAFRQNQYGGSVGGPIIKNKTFFFADYEDLAYAQGLAAAFYTVPTYCEHGMGNASSPLAKPCPDGGTTVGDFSDNPAVSLPGTPPAAPGGKWGGGSTTLCSAAQYGTSACPYVVVPQSAITPTGLAFFNMFPLPNTGAAGAFTNNYTAALVRVQNAKTLDGRVDEHFSDKDSLFGHITYNGETTINPNGFPNVNINPATGALASAGASGALKVEPVVTSYAGPNNEDQYFFGLSEVHVFSPSLILNVKAGVMRSQILSFPANQGTEVSNKLGIPCNATACVDYANGSSIVGASGLVHISVRDLNSGTSYTTIGDTTFIPLGYWDTSLQYFGTLTWNKGSHSVRFGLGLIRRRAGVGQSNAPQGQFNFNGSFTGQAMGDLLEGLGSGQSRNNALVQEGFRSWEPSGYIQDDWRTRPWLTLNLGVRYDIFTPYTEVHGRITNYDPYNGLLVGPSLPGLQQTGPTDMVPTPYSDIAPRFGFAATLKGNMVLRGGVGITFMPQNYESQYYFQNAPFDFASSCTLQNNAPNGGSNNSCLAPVGPYPAGEFGSNQTAIYGTPTSGSTKNSSTLGQGGGTTFANSLPVPILLTSLATNTALYTGTTIQAVPPNLKEAYLEQFNLQLQKQFGGNVVTVGYVGELGRHLANFLGGPFNQNVAANPVQANGGNQTLPMSVGGATNDGFGTLPGFPYLATVDVGETPNTGTSAYNALQATFIRRFGKGLTANINYTWSHSLDNFLNTYACTESMFAAPAPCWVDEAKGAGPSLLNATDQGACAAEGASVCRNYYGWQQYAWGNSPNDVQDRIAWGVDYALPFGNSLRGVSAVFIKGWSTNVSGSWQTGLPYAPTAVVNNTDISSGYADQVCSGKAANPSILLWFNPNCFIDPTPGTLGNERAGSLMGPHQKRLDFSLFKTFDLNERVKLQFRTEVFNLFNQTNFGQPSSSIQFTGAASPTNLNSAPPVVISLPGGGRTTGEITATSGNWNPRQIQFALKVLF